MPHATSRQAPGLLACWLLLDAAIGVYLWFDGPSNVSRVLLAGGVALLLYVLIRRPGLPAGPSAESTELGLGLLLALSLMWFVAVPYRPELPAPTVPVAGLALVALIALAVGGLTWFRTRRRGGPGEGESQPVHAVVLISLGVVISAGLIARFAIAAWDVKPGFDIYFIQEAAGRAILAGRDPYLTHVFHTGYPYWPMSAVVAAAGLELGDARWSLLAADAATLIGFIAIARNVGLPRRIGAMAGALLLWDSGGLFITWQSMTEPLVIACMTGAIALLTRPRPRGLLAGVALGFAIATKQFAVGFIALLPLSRNRQQRTAFLAAFLAAGLVVLPFFARSPAAFVEGSIVGHLAEQSRGYALNLLDPLPGIVAPIHLPFVVTGLLALATSLIVRLRWPDAVDGWIAGTVALIIVAIALIGTSFLNYYQMPLALILVLVLLPEGTSSGTQWFGTSSAVDGARRNPILSGRWGNDEPSGVGQAGQPPSA